MERKVGGELWTVLPCRCVHELYKAVVRGYRCLFDVIAGVAFVTGTQDFRD